MRKARFATSRLARTARRLMRRGRPRVHGRAERGFVCAYVGGRWRGGWYETGFGTVNLSCGDASACARRVQGLPSRFEALFLLCRLAKTSHGV